MDPARKVTFAVAGLAQELGSSFSLAAVQDLAEQFGALQQAQVRRLRELAEYLGAPEDPAVESMGWMLAIKETARFIAIGNEAKTNQKGIEE